MDPHLNVMNHPYILKYHEDGSVQTILEAELTQGLKEIINKAVESFEDDSPFAGEYHVESSYPNRYPYAVILFAPTYYDTLVFIAEGPVSYFKLIQEISKTSIQIRASEFLVDYNNSKDYESNLVRDVKAFLRGNTPEEE